MKSTIKPVIVILLKIVSGIKNNTDIYIQQDKAIVLLGLSK